MNHFINYSRSKTLCVGLKTSFLTALFVLVASASVFGASANLSWDANTEPDLSGYKVYIGTTPGSYGSPASVGNITTYVASGLAEGTYFFAVTAIDTSGNESGFSNEVSKIISTTTDTTPPVISSISSAGITSSRATISWSSNEASDTQIQYGRTTTYGTTTGLNASLTTSHSQGLSGLASSTLYHYRVLSRDAAGNLSASADNTFTTTSLVDTTPPSISAVVTSNISINGLTVSWMTNEASDAGLEYGTTSAYGSASLLDSRLISSHAVTLTGLTSNTIYHFRVLSRDVSGNLATSGDFSFTTLDVPDTAAPVLSGITVSGVTATGAIITWSTDEGASSQVDYGKTSAYGLSTLKGTSLLTSHSRTLSGLSPETTYHYQVRSSDSAGNEALSGNGTFTTPVSTGLTITNLKVGSGLPYEIVHKGLSNGEIIYIDRTYTFEGVPALLNGATYIKTANDDKSSTGSAFLTFDVSEGVTVYIAHDDRILVKPLWLSVFTDTGDDIIVTGTAHSLFKKAFSTGPVSLGGNEASGKSMYVVIIDTGSSGGGPTDTTSPLLSNVLAGNITSIAADITWSTDEAATSQVEYGTTVAYGSLSEKNTTGVTNHKRSLSGLSGSTTYHYRLISFDAAGNKAMGVDRSFTTLSPVLNGPTLSNILAGNISETNAAITWVTNESASAQVEYGTTTTYGLSSDLNATLLFSHSASLSGLRAGTTYHYRVLSRDANGNLSVSANNSFQTLAASDTRAPGSVVNFSAVSQEGRVLLSWVNPTDSDFVGVRIRFRTDRFPTDVNDGTLLGDISGDRGQQTQMNHVGLTRGLRYFYLISAYDGSGNFQNPVFVSVTPKPAAGQSVAGNETSGGAGGCGMIRPGNGGPPGPGDAAAMLTLFGFILLILLKKVSGLFPVRLFAKNEMSRI